MAVWSTTSKMRLFIDKRMDAEFYQPAYQRFENAVRCVGHFDYLHNLGDFIIGPFGSAFDTNNYEISSVYRYIRGRDVKPFVLLDDDNRYIPETDYLRLHRYHVKDDDIFISVVGTLGNAAICPTPGIKAIFSCKSTVFRHRDIDAYYILTYLNSSFGYNSMIRRQRGAVQGGLNKEDLATVPVPRFDESIEKEIGSIVRKAFRARNQAQSFYSSARALLSSALKENELKFDHPLSYTTRFSDVMREGRADADYFQVPYIQLAQQIRGNTAGFVQLTEHCDFLSPNANPDKTPNEEFSYVELADINAGLGVIDACEKYRGSDLPSRARRRVKAGDVLASSVVGSIDKSAVIGKDQEGFIASTGFFHLRPKDVSTEFLLMLMRSTIVQMQLRQQATGGILSGVPDSRVKYIIVPKVNRDLQKEITAKVRAAHKKHKESLELLAAAKARVEELIESAVK